MKNEQNTSMKYSRSQIVVLTLLRLLLGYHFLYEGLDKLFNSNWTSGGFLIQANWLFADFFHWLANNSSLIPIVDALNIYGQILIGLGLILGLFSRYAAVSGAVLLLLYYIAIPPFMNDLFFVDRNFIELIAFFIVILFSTSENIGLDRLVKLKWNETK